MVHIYTCRCNRDRVKAVLAPGRRVQVFRRIQEACDETGGQVDRGDDTHPHQTPTPSAGDIISLVTPARRWGNKMFPGSFRAAAGRVTNPSFYPPAVLAARHSALAILPRSW
ncbi:hypothetical protein EYF80_047876 [Liparis tanakae]|uniref:Uncharacterized protein n=1 Tax=Liparis tanakae TaxID=230148 RepID=A0A4Z2FM10_9TELE|nr:hypothetical protein EYF80_047876 [Liparis tanakae]